MEFFTLISTFFSFLHFEILQIKNIYILKVNESYKDEIK